MEDRRESYEAIDALNARGWKDSIIVPGKTLPSTFEAFELSEALCYEAGMANARLNSGWCYVYLGKIDDALSSFEIARDLFESVKDDRGSIFTLNGIGTCYQIMSRYDLATERFLESLELSRALGDREREASALNFIGGIHLELGHTKDGLDYLMKAYDAMSGIEEPEVEGHIVGNIGRAFKEMGNLELAADFTRKAISFAERLDDRIRQCECFTTLGQIELESNRHEGAFEWLAKAMETCKASGNLSGRVQILQNLGDLLKELGKRTEARQRFGEALEIALAMRSKRHVSAMKYRLSLLSEEEGDAATALLLYKEASRLEHEAINEETTKTLKDMQFKHEISRSKSEAEIFRLKNVELKEQAERLETANLGMALMAEIGQKIMTNLSADSIIRLMSKELPRIMTSSSAGIVFFHRNRMVLRYRMFSATGRQMPAMIVDANGGASIALRAILKREPVIIADIQAEAPSILAGKPRKPEYDSGSAVAIPLYTKGNAFAALLVQSRATDAYGANEKNLLIAMSQYISIALENAQNHDRLERLCHELKNERDGLEQASREIARLANHDNLTGLPNRRLLFELLRQSFDLSMRSGDSVAIVYIDLDDFKPINDAFGHQAGDRALVAVAERLKSVLRTSDTVARVGGDEFVVCLNAVGSRENAKAIASKIAQECQFPYELNGTEHRIAMSMGISLFPDDGTTIDQLLHSADAAMYESKRKRKLDRENTTGIPEPLRKGILRLTSIDTAT